MLLYLYTLRPFSPSPLNIISKQVTNKITNILYVESRHSSFVEKKVYIDFTLSQKAYSLVSAGVIKRKPSY